MQFRPGKTAQNGPQKMSRLAYLMAGIFFRLHLRQKKKPFRKDNFFSTFLISNAS